MRLPLKVLYEARSGDGRATCDLSDGARAATYGAIETLLVDMDAVVPGIGQLGVDFDKPHRVLRKSAQ